MISDFIGIFTFDEFSIKRNAPILMGVYYCGEQDGNKLLVHYVGRAKGEDVSIRGRLLDHLRESVWNNVRHFAYKICTTKREAEMLEAEEILRLQPLNNVYGK